MQRDKIVGRKLSAFVVRSRMTAYAGGSSIVFSNAFCAAFSQGNVGKAIQLASSEEFGELKASVLQLMKRLEDIDLYEMTAAVKQIAEYKLTVNDYFDLMMIWFRDVLYMKATNDVNGFLPLLSY